MLVIIIVACKSVLLQEAYKTAMNDMNEKLEFFLQTMCTQVLL